MENTLILDLRQEARAISIAVGDPKSLRVAAQETWFGRMKNEFMSSFVFAQLSDQFAELGLDEERDACLQFSAEERRHGFLCGAVVEAFGGTAQAHVEPPARLPRHHDTTLRAAVVRNVISVCCMAETVAVALIGAERLEMPEGELRELLTKIYADEVGHSRFGWSYLARVWPLLNEDERASVRKYIPIALAHLEEHELAHLPLSSAPSADGAAFGLCSGSDARTLYFETVADVIRPGLAQYGLVH